MSGSIQGPSDPGLAAERTSLAWARMGLSLLAIPSAMAAYASSRNLVATVAAGWAGVLGLALLTLSVRRHRAAPGMVESRELRPAIEQVILTAGSALLLNLAGLILVAS